MSLGKSQQADISLSDAGSLLCERPVDMPWGECCHPVSFQAIVFLATSE